MTTYKNWFFNMEGYSRWNNFWGETMNLGENLIILYSGYNTPKWSASIMIINPFTSYYSVGSVNYSALANYTANIYTHNLGQVICINFSLNLNFGRKYNVTNKRLDNTDTDAGIMTGTKK